METLSPIHINVKSFVLILSTQPKKNIGANTVRRVLGFLKKEHSTSLKTLDILAEYSGYDNWSSFTEQADKLKYEPLSI